jgi:hypothetical protein
LPGNHAARLAIADGAAHHPMKHLLHADTAQAIKYHSRPAFCNDPIKMVIALVGLITILAFRG